MRSMTYGTLPSRREFVRAFDREVPSGIYYISGRPAERDDVAGEYSCSQLWHLVVDLTRAWNEAQDETEAERAGQWASNILGTFGFEWI